MTQDTEWDNLPKWKKCACGTLHCELNFTKGKEQNWDNLVRTFSLIHPPNSDKSGRKHFCNMGSVLGLILESHFWGYKGDKKTAIEHTLKELENMDLCEQAKNEGKPSCIASYVDIIRKINKDEKI